MSRLRFNWDTAVAHLRAQCSPMCAFIDEFGKRRYTVGRVDLFRALARSITYQQLSGKAAGTIHGRFEALFESGVPNAEQAAGTSIPLLRSAGLSQAKAMSILDLARKSVDGQLPGPRHMAGMSDQELIDALSQVRGIGPWTAQMHLIFYLGRPDVMPATDLGVQKGVQNIYRLRALPSPKQTLDRTAHLAPYRSAAAWYFWRASEL